MEQLQDFYLVNRRTLFAIAEPGASPDLENALDACLRISGVNPRQLANYPVLIEKLNTFLQAKLDLTRLVEEGNFTTIFGAPKNYFESVFTWQHLQAFLDQLIKEDAALYRRITNMLVETEDCCVCMTESCDTLFQCGHRYCRTCSQKVQQCPLCRKVVSVRVSASKEEMQHVAVIDAAAEVDEKEDGHGEEGRRHSSKSKVKMPRFVFITNVQNFLQTRVQALLKSSGTVDHQSKEELKLLIEHYGEKFIEVLKTTQTIKSEELISFIVAQFFLTSRLLEKNEDNAVIWSAEQKNLANSLKYFIDRPNRIIRILAVFAGGNPETGAKDMKVDLPNEFRRYFVECLNSLKNFDDAVLDMRSRNGFWRVFFTSIHIGEKRYEKYLQAQKLARVVRRKEKVDVRSKVSKFDELVDSKDKKIFEEYKQEPGLFMRNFCNLIVKFSHDIKGKNELKDLIFPLLKVLKQKQLVELKTIIINKIAQFDEKHRVFRVKTGSLYQIDKSFMSSTAQNNLKQCSKLINQELASRPSPLPPTHTLVIDEDFLVVSHESFVPKGRPPKVPSWAQTVMAAGDSVIIDNMDAEIIVFIHWMHKSDDQVDLDLSVLILDEEDEMIQQISYTKLQDQARTIVHSGDLVDAYPPNGSAEYIKFVPKKFLNAHPRSRRMLVQVFSYNQVAFDSLQAAVVGFGVIDPAAPGLGPMKSNVLAACELRGNSKCNLAGILEIAEDKSEIAFVFANTNLKVHEGKPAAIENLKKSVIRNSKNFLDWKRFRHPTSLLQFMNALIYSAPKVVKITGEKPGRKAFVYFRKPTETAIDFVERFQKTDGEDLFSLYMNALNTKKEGGGQPGQAEKNGSLYSEFVKELTVATMEVDIQSDHQVKQEPKMKVVYFGNDAVPEELGKVFDLTSQSVQVSKTNCANEMTWLRDPFAVFDLVETKSVKRIA